MDADPLLSILLMSDPFISTDTISIPMLLLTVFLVLLNGFFVAAEFAIVKVRASQIEVRTDLNQGLATTAKKIVSNLDSYLAATQLGITLASLGLGWVGESALTPVIIKTFDLFNLSSPEWVAIAHKISFPIAFVIITMLHIIFGELAPKSIAIQYPSKTTFAIAWPLRVFYFVFSPVIWLMNGIANLILRMLGIKPLHGSDIHTEEELKMIISESQEGGAIEETERALIQNVFDFDDRRVINIQTLRKNVSAISSTATIEEALKHSITEGYSRYPVFEDSLDNIKGILYTKDLFKQMINQPEAVTIDGILREAEFVYESAKIKNVLKNFQRKRLQMAVVTNEVGEVTGIVTMEDILEELVGEIQDEYDNEEPIVSKVAEGVYKVSAHHPISDINRYVPFRFDESEHYDTLAGLIAEIFPEEELKEGDVINLDEYEARILKMYRNSVEKVELSLKTTSPLGGNSM